MSERRRRTPSCVSLISVATKKVNRNQTKFHQMFSPNRLMINVEIFVVDELHIDFKRLVRDEQ